VANYKTWRMLKDEISETFRKWHVTEWELIPEKEPAKRTKHYHALEERLVKVRWRLPDGRWITLSDQSQDYAHGNLQNLALAIESMRMNAVRKISRLVAGAYALMSPPPGVRQAHPSVAEPIEANDPYVLLGVTSNYPLAIIETIWRARLKVEHPDMGGNAERAKALNAAMDAIRKKLA